MGDGVWPKEEGEKLEWMSDRLVESWWTRIACYVGCFPFPFGTQCGSLRLLGFMRRLRHAPVIHLLTVKRLMKDGRDKQQ